MKKLNVAIIGQGRSGKDIHGKFFKSEANELFNVKYVVDSDQYRREVAEKYFEGCKSFSDYRELFNIDDIDLVVNASYSELHYPITKDLILHKKNVLTEKPFARSRYECDELIKLAEENGVVLAVFQQTFLAPFYKFAYEISKSGRIGEIKQISIRYNSFSRRWDWQTLQKKCAGSTYNTGPHPIGMALGFLDFDPDTKLIYSKLDTALTFGDADDYAKIILSAPNKPLIDIEMSSIDAYSDYTLKLQGSKGTLKSKVKSYEMTYIIDGENQDHSVSETFISDAEGKPAYCKEALVKHTEENNFEGDAFNIGTADFYKQLYHKIVDGTPMSVTAQMAAQIISVIEGVHAQNPLPLKF